MLQGYWCYRIQVLSIYKFAMHGLVSPLLFGKLLEKLERFKSRANGIRVGVII